jgi:hypothetical protein
MASSAKKTAARARTASTVENEHQETLKNESFLTKVKLYGAMAVLFPLAEMGYFIGIFGSACYFGNSYVRAAATLYATNALLVLDGAPSHDGFMAKFWANPRMHSYFRKLTFWTWARDYFSAELIKTAELPPNNNYLICYHPHGIISMGLQCSMGMDSCNFPEVFPGIDRYVATLTASFKIPIFREWILAHGFVSCGSHTMKKILTTPNKSLVLVPGGANEALYAHPGEFKVHLKNRKGFVRVAIQCGASVVPAIGFGENELFYTLDNESPGFGSLLYKVQVFLMKKASFSIPVFTHFLPKREKLTVVVGSPISTKAVQCDKPSQELIDKVHKEYCDQIEKLWNDHKELYGKGIPFEIA